MAYFNTTQAVADTAKEAVQKGGSDTGWILHHIYDSNKLDFDLMFTRVEIPLPTIHLLGYDISITKHVVFMWLACIILVGLLLLVSKKYQKSRVPSGVSNLFEILIVFVRDEIVKPTIGKGYEYFLPYLLTAFFFILTCNFLGLLPYSATVTSNISVTATLAVLSFIMILIGGIKHHGFFGYFKGLLPHGLPGWLVPVMFIVEFLGLFTKPFALAIRLFANMTAGHVVILSLFALMFIMKTLMFAPVSVAFALFIYMLELLVCVIQAYIFTMLSGLFIGMAVHQEH